MKKNSRKLRIFFLGTLAVCMVIATRASISQTDSKSEMPKSGRWRRARTPDYNEKDEQLFSELIALGYLEGYNPAPQSKNVTFYNKDRTYNGLNFYVSGHAPEALLVDMHGNNIHRWHYKNAQDIWPVKRKDSKGSFWRRAHLYKNGDVLAVYEGIGLIKLDKDSQLLWSYAGPKTPHHDLEVLEDGTIYVLTREYKVIPRINKKPVFEDFITLLTPEGKEKKHISLLVLLEESPYARLRDEDTIGFYGDIFHTNTLEVFDGTMVEKSPLFKKGNVMVSILVLNTIFIIDMESEKIVWAAGSGMWKRQHQPTLLKNGHILIFDNHYRKNSSQIIEYHPFTQEIVWSYRGNEKDHFFSLTCGSNQRLPNGNTLITETDFGRVFEVGMDSETVWEFISPYRVGDNNEFIATIPEMIRIEPEFVLFFRLYRRRYRWLRSPHCSS